MGEDRAIEAAKQAVSSPLLETSIHGATDAIINITGGANLTLFEAEQAAEVVRAAANTDINTVIATGFDKKNKKPLYKEINKVAETNYIDDDEEEDDNGGTTFEPQEIEIPTFMHRNF